MNDKETISSRKEIEEELKIENRLILTFNFLHLN